MWRQLHPIALACLLMCLSAQTGMSQPPQKSVLVVYTARIDSPSRVAGERAFQLTLNERVGRQVDFYSEYIDPWRLSEPDYQSALHDFLSRKYKGVHFDLVVTVAGSAFDFISRHGPELFPGVPVVFGGSGGRHSVSQLRAGPGFTGLYDTLDLRASLEIALQLQPSVRRVYVVSGSSETDRFYESLARQQFREFEQRVSFTYLTGKALEALQRDIAMLPPQSIVYYLVVTQDGAGTRFIPVEFLTKIAATANAPVYSFAEGFLGSGIVGGSLVSDELLGRQTAELAGRILMGEEPEDIPIAEAKINVVAFDWRKLQRWGISEDRLPPQSIIRYREPTLWEQYQGRIVGVIALCAFQTLLIATLLVQRKRRRGAEHEQHKANQALERVTGRLLLLQDEERRRVAAELHDGLGQSLAIIKNRVIICQRTTSDPELVKEQLDEISATATSAIDEVREIAHNLRPYELDRLGLIAAIESMIGRIADSTAIKVSADLEPIDHLLSQEAETSVYRIVQEGLNNVVKHSHATTARVEIKRTGRQLLITVQDNGRGMSPPPAERTDAKNQGFGLVGISERVRLLGGSHTIDSAPARGTRLTVRLEPSHVAAE